MSRIGNRKSVLPWTFLLLIAALLLSAAADNPKSVSFNYQQGKIPLAGGVATLNVPESFGFLDSEQTRKVLVELWGNPDSETPYLGMIVPKSTPITAKDSWAVIFEYSEEGHVADDEAKSIDYQALLKEMQEGVQSRNAERKEAGYPAITLAGWAEPPHYDAATHKLYWAKRLQFEGEAEDTLNYSIRVLGRKGVLELNIVSSISQLPEINKHVSEILAMVDFSEGQKYSDFDPKMDKLAVYGIGALIAGKVAAKAGFIKLLLAGILAAKKFLILAAVAMVGFVKRLFGRGSTTQTSSHGIDTPPTSSGENSQNTPS